MECHLGWTRVGVIEDPGMQDDSDVDELLAMHAEQLTDTNGSASRIRTCDLRLRGPNEVTPYHGRPR